MSTRKIHHYMAVVLLCALSACIPSKSEREKTVKAKEPVPETSKAAISPAPPAAAATPAPTPESKPQESADTKDDAGALAFSLKNLDKVPTPETYDENDPIAVAKRLNEQAMSNGGVVLITADDGIGFTVKGANGLTGTFKPDSSGESWTFDAEFVAKTEGLKVGKEQITTVGDGVPNALQDKESTKGIYMIVIPVQLPDINAIETGDTYKVPVHFSVKASGTPQFMVSTMPVKNL